MLTPIDRQSLADAVFGQLRGEILAGRLAAGADLPSERELCETLGVSRPALREALARLAQAGLVHVRHGEKTRVADWRKSAGLDLLSQVFASLTDPEVLRGALEMRAALGPEVARRCAERSPEAGEALHRVVTRMEGEADVVSLRRLNVDFWQLLVEGSQNVAYQLAYNSLRRAVDPVEELVAGVLRTELSDVAGFRAIADAVAAGDANGAAAAAARQLASPTKDGARSRAPRIVESRSPVPGETDEPP